MSINWGVNRKCISICDHNTIFTVDTDDDLVNFTYIEPNDDYDKSYIAHYVYKISCASHDKSLWFTGYREQHAHLLINRNKR